MQYRAVYAYPAPNALPSRAGWPGPMNNILKWLLVASALILPLEAVAPQEDVLAAARAIPDGGSYNSEFKGSGTPEEIIFKNARILSKGDGTYCSGFTFAVAVRVAEKHGLLSNKTVDQVRKLQAAWYGQKQLASRIVEKQCVAAMTDLGIGAEVQFNVAQPGDFVQFYREEQGDNGHSAVFLGWVEENGKRVGIKYRSSQLHSKPPGVADNVEYFQDASNHKGKIYRPRTYFGRLSGSAR
jgi:hypothetical protein